MISKPVSAHPVLSTGLCSVTFRQLDADEVIRLAAEGGIAGIEWGSDKHVSPGNLAHAREVAGRCRDRGIAVASIGSYVEAGADQGQDASAILELAEAMAAPNIRVWAGKRGVSAAAATAADRRQTAAALRNMTERADGLGISISLEFHPETLTDDLQSTLDLLGDVDRPSLWTYWQPWPGIALASALEQVAALEGRMSHLHVFSWTVARDRLPLAAREDFRWLAATGSDRGER